MILRLWYYFGLLGTGAVMAEIAALGLLATAALRTRRQFFLVAGLALATLGFALARVNSARVSAIKVDRAEEMEAARQAMERERAAAAAVSGNLSSRAQFAEDTPDGATTSWRARGRQQREAGKRQTVSAATETSLQDTSSATKGRVMKEEDVFRANRYDRINLFAARAILLLLAVVLGWDYLRQFNTTFAAYWPLPISGAWLDTWQPKTRAVYLPATGPASLPRLLETAVRKGESFVYFGPADPWPNRTGLPRLSIRGRTLWQLPKLVRGDTGVPADTGFLFDAAWFDRYGVVIPSTDAAPELLDALAVYLAQRVRTRARAKRTIHLVWDLDDMPADTLLKTLVALCRETNFKLIFRSARPVPPELASRFEEILA